MYTRSLNSISSTSVISFSINVAKFEQDNTKIEQFYALAEKYTDFSELTTPMLNEFVEKVLVHAPDRSSGTREQEVEIYLNFIGNIDFPIPEPTPEEIEQMKIDKYWKKDFNFGSIWDKHRYFANYLIYTAPLAYADLIMNGKSEVYWIVVIKHKSSDWK